MQGSPSEPALSGDTIAIADAPAVAGLRFRRFRGANDYPAMVAVLQASSAADGIERAATVEHLAESYGRLSNCDVDRDMILAEVAGELVGYARGWWWDEPQTGRLYGSIGYLAPEWRRRGIGSALLAWLERRQREQAESLPAETPRTFQVGVAEGATSTARLLEAAHYQPARYFYELVRPSLEAIPDVPLPAGFEVRPARPEHYRAIWRSIDQASRDEWGYIAPTEEAYQAWLSDPHFQPELWQIAWDVARELVAGHVLTFIDRAENESLQRRRGYTEGIGVGPAWRRRGLARALIVRSLRAQRDAGMTESAMAVDNENASGALRLYESCGFQPVRRDAIYRKAF